MLILQTFLHSTYVTAILQPIPSLYLRHSSFSNPSVASPTSQLVLQSFFRFSYVTGFSLTSPGEPPIEAEAVRRVHEENSFRSANQIRTAANFPGSFRAVMNRLRDANIYCRRAASKEGLTGTSCRPPSLRNRLGGFRLIKCNLHRRNIHLFRL